MIRWVLERLFKAPEKPKIPTITDKYRVNRMIRTMYNNGDYTVVHPVLHHYAFVIDGRRHVLGIAEVLSAIKALEEVGK